MGEAMDAEQGEVLLDNSYPQLPRTWSTQIIVLHIQKVPIKGEKTE